MSDPEAPESAAEPAPEAARQIGHLPIEASKPLSRVARWLGIAVTVAACLWVLVEIRQTDLLAAPFWQRPQTWWGVSGLGLLYAGAGVLLAAAWVLLLNSGSWGRLAPLQGLSIFARTQLYKYLPSNVLHLAGRFTSARRQGVPGSAIVRSTALEHASLLVVALACAASLAATYPVLWAQLVVPAPLLVAGLGLLAALALAAGRKRWRSLLLDRLRPREAFSAAALHALFFLATGLIVAGLGAFAGTSLAPRSAAATVGVVAAAWLAGTITPGAPGGVGVREAVLLLGLEPLYGPQVAAFMATAYRLVTLLGDLVLAAWGWLARPRG